MQTHWKWKAVGALAAWSLGAAACSGLTEVESRPSVSITVSQPQLSPGQSTNVLVTAMDSGGEAGSGSVVIKASAGQLGSGGAEATVSLAAGAATTTFSCPSSDPKCAGRVELAAEWEDAQSTVALVVATPDAGP